MVTNLLTGILLTSLLLGGTGAETGSIRVSSPPPGVAQAWTRQIGAWTLSRTDRTGSGLLVSCSLMRENPDGGRLSFTAPAGQSALQVSFARGGSRLAQFGSIFGTPYTSFDARYWVDQESTARAASGTVLEHGFALLGETIDGTRLLQGRELVIRIGRETPLRYTLEGADVAVPQLLECLQGK